MSTISADLIRTRIDLNSIPKFSAEPILSIPTYLFKNKNPKTFFLFSDLNLELTRNNIEKITPTDATLFLSDKEGLKKQKELSWIYGLHKVENLFLKDPQFIKEKKEIDYETIFQIKDLFSRFSTPYSPEIRKENCILKKTDSTLTEDIIYDLFYKSISSEIKNDDWIAHLSNLSKTKINFFLDREFFKKSLQEYMRNYNASLFLNFALKKFQEGQKIELCIAEKSVEDCVVNDKINMTKWLKRGFYFFPEASIIEEELLKIIELLNDPLLHPIEIASRIWFEILRLHVFTKGNKKIGKTIATIILLKHGYLPPKILDTRKEKFSDCLIFFLESKNGSILFTNWIAHKILKTQREEEKKSEEVFIDRKLFKLNL